MCVVKGQEQTAEVLKRDVGRLRVSLMYGETLWVEWGAIKGVLSAEETAKVKAAWKEAKLAKMQEDAAAISTRRW